MFPVLLIHGWLFAQTAASPATPAVLPESPTFPRLGFEAAPPIKPIGDQVLGPPHTCPLEQGTTTLTEVTAPAPLASESCSIFSRPPFADRHGLGFVLGAGPGRFNLIEWESRPSYDRLWWLERWPRSEEVRIYASIGFNMYWWAGPVSTPTAAAPNLPPRVYDLYLDFSWAQRWAEWLTSEVRFRPGMYTDFRTTPPDSFRAPGQAFALLRVKPTLAVVGGIDYVQRNDVQLLPVGGVLWQPTPRWELRLVFPEPKIAFELSERAHLWGYIAGEYGGGRWTYEHEQGYGERVEYSDFRLVAGIEWREDYLSQKNLPLLSEKSSSFLEVGYIFERHLRFSAGTPEFAPEPTWMIRFGRVW